MGGWKKIIVFFLYCRLLCGIERIMLFILFLEFLCFFFFVTEVQKRFAFFADFKI